MKTLAIAVALFFAAPALSFAATFAYVNSAGEVMSMEASNADQALMTAPGIDVHSGVMLLDGDDAGVVGDSVPGV